jgi:hypothetical protein
LWAAFFAAHVRIRRACRELTDGSIGLILLLGFVGERRWENFPKMFGKSSRMARRSTENIVAFPL